MRELAQDALENPFPGLRSFQEEEEHLFFGRENQVDTMVDKLAATHFLTVVGTSGSGKSSLVNCGLRPALRRGLMAGAGTSWRMAQFRPGNEPIRAMARALAENDALSSDDDDDDVLPLPQLVETTLRMSKLGLIDVFEQAGLGADVNLLLVVDQFEELFRYRQLVIASPDEGRAAEEVTAFVNLLLEVRERAPARIFVVLTMRSDFLGDCTQFPGLAEAINAGQYLVPRLTRDERRDAIEGPVQVRGAQLSPVLLTQLVNDVGDNPDQLSILQHALNRTWAYWRKQGGQGPLELEHYAAIGTMAKALNQHADEALRDLANDRQRQICEKMFKALTDKASDPRGVRRPTTAATLCALTDGSMDEITSVVDVFREKSRSFLMPSIKEKLRADSVVDISHESLMRVWEQLNSWASEEAQSVRVYRRLAEAAQEYGRGETSLYTDPQLQVALDWRKQNRPNATWAERYHPGFVGAMAFLDKSRAKAAEQKRRQQRALRITQATALGMSLLAAAAGYFGWMARQASVDADASREISRRTLVQSERSKSSRLALLAAQDPTNQSRKILLALESLPDQKSSDADVAGRPRIQKMQQLLASSIRSLREVLIFDGHSEAVNSVVVVADGKRIITGSDDRTVRLWESGTGDELARVEVEDAVLSVAASSDGQRIVARLANGAVRVWPASLQGTSYTLDGHGSRVFSVALAQDGTRIVSGSDDGIARVYDVDSGKQLLELEKQTNAILGVAVAPGGGKLVTGQADRTARVWDARTGSELVKLQGHLRSVSGVAVSPDETRIITWSADRTVRLWDSESGEELQRIELGATPLSVAWAPNVNRTNAIVVGTDNDSVSVWAVAPRKEAAPILVTKSPEFIRLRGHNGDVRSLAITPDGRAIVTVSADNTARIWKVVGPYAEVDTPDDTAASQVLVEVGRRVVPRCLTLQERIDLELTPRPPTWCIKQGKYPYNTEFWRDWEAGKQRLDSKLSERFGNFSDDVLKKGGDARIALDAAQLGIDFDPSKLWIRVNRAHAFMFLGQTDLARKEYLQHCAEKLEVEGDVTWRDGVLQDFQKLRANGRSDPLMDEIEQSFGSGGCPPAPYKLWRW
ncbi:WD40 repeat domain-containing protein [Bradyrhizobium sp. 138]|uniref:NACHT and WD repeat domain-containing protein n=1 Tax=Bradyrhizobium sp. 138 TaxID=2782615 RepID=UPI001FF80EAD|nr:WD40 repeat domain-containing protein [Bradyrhizobium sp. 138]MCK1739167.1 WD40 repeat domain-containing protein [Bradyrhizobium sp. 138]